MVASASTNLVWFPEDLPKERIRLSWNICTSRKNDHISNIDDSCKSRRHVLTSNVCENRVFKRLNEVIFVKHPKAVVKNVEPFLRCILKIVYDRAKQIYFCLYIRKNYAEKFYLLMYVTHDIIMSKSICEISFVKQYLSKQFDMVDLGELNQFLEIVIKRDIEKKILKFSQPKYLIKELQRINMKD